MFKTILKTILNYSMFRPKCSRLVSLAYSYLLAKDELFFFMGAENTRDRFVREKTDYDLRS